MTEHFKGEQLVLINEDGTKEDKGYYYVDQFQSEDITVYVVGGMAEGLLFAPEEDVEFKTAQSNPQEQLLNVLVDVASSIKHLTEKIDHLIPKCECGEDMCCGPMPNDCDEECDCEECTAEDDEEPKLN